MRAGAAVVLAALSGACGGAPAAPPREAPPAAERTLDPEVAQRSVMARLAKTDRRLAHRLDMKPEGIALLFPENRAPAELDALFEYQKRGLELTNAASLIEATKQRVRPGYDWRGLDRLVAEEQARLADEKDMPLGASAMIRSLTFDLPKQGLSADDLASEDRGLATTIDRLRETLSEQRLGVMQLAELDDQLDAFEKGTMGFATAPAAVARLRVALSQAKPRPTEDVPAWALTERRLGAFAGALPSDIDARLERAHGPLRQRLATLLPKSSAERARLASDAVIALLAPAPCPEKTGVAREPVERFAMCTMLGMAAKGEDVRSLLMLDLALDFARWALAVHRTRTKPSEAFAVLRTHIPLDESDGAHAFRFALVHPVEAITLGWTAALVASAPQERAKRWLSGGAKTPGEMTPLLM